MVAAVDALVELATLTNDTVIEPHAERLTALLEQVRPLLGRLAERSDILATLIVDLGRFVERFPKAVHNGTRSEEHTSELQSLMRISYAVFCLKNKTYKTQHREVCTSGTKTKRHTYSTDQTV